MYHLLKLEMQKRRNSKFGAMVGASYNEVSFRYMFEVPSGHGGENNCVSVINDTSRSYWR